MTTYWFNGKEYLDEMDKLNAEIEYYSKKNASKPTSTKTKKPVKRKTKRVGPGHTVVDYPKRTLHIYFTETKTSYDKKTKARRKASARKGAKTRRNSAPQYTYDPDTGLYRTKSGKITNAPVRQMYEYNSGSYRSGAKSDKYGELSDMRALLKDAHWEEYCGHKRWLTNDTSLIREYQAYQRMFKHLR